MTIKRCGLCERWSAIAGGVCGIGWGQRPRRADDSCSGFVWAKNPSYLESAVREAGLEERYVANLLGATGIDAELWVSNIDGEGELTNAIAVIIALAALTDSQRAQAARETLEEGVR